ncbi:hypothetical protein SSPO_081850 [Streptomyces antimycoticus]|uniref:Uncharacterized protein n=1 Tax=Streptomyces antimycoticus TaxID=68175 RepID=A0A499VH24_9ACTN|nr:hypothetical protein [Streptomyces antimycoticus]BBJ45467.1 hypothetical protein SSPO_081850 [Streptomyces antimycoticus]
MTRCAGEHDDAALHVVIDQPLNKAPSSEGGPAPAPGSTAEPPYAEHSTRV